MNYICMSGGAEGSDTIFELESIKNDIKVISYSFNGHNTRSRNRYILTDNELNEGFEKILESNKILNKNLSNISKYVKNLLSRNWFQVKNSDTIFAIGTLKNDIIVNGGTGYAVAMAMIEKKPIYVFEQNRNVWFYFNYNSNKFEVFNGTPILTEKFAGIGTRNINNYGIEAIKSLFNNYILY